MYLVIAVCQSIHLALSFLCEVAFFGPPVASRPHPLLRPLKPKDRPDDLSAGNTFIICLFNLLCYTIEDRISLSFKKGHSRAWPFSSRNLLLLIKDDFDMSTGDDSGVIRACASAFVQRLADWSVCVPHSALVRLMTATVDMCGTLILPAVLETSFTITVVCSLARNVIDTAMHALRKIGDDETTSSCGTALIEVGRWIVTSISVVEHYFGVVTFRRDMPFDSQEAFSLSSHRMKLAQLFTMMMYLLNDSRISNSIRRSQLWKFANDNVSDVCFLYHWNPMALYGDESMWCSVPIYPRVLERGIENLKANPGASSHIRQKCNPTTEESQRLAQLLVLEIYLI